MDRHAKGLRSATVAIVFCIALLGLAAPAPAAAPPGPRLATVELIETKGSEQDEPTESPFVALTTFGPSGGQRRHLLKQRFDATRAMAPFPFFGPSWSGDGGTIAFVGFRGKTAGIAVVDADGARPRFVGVARSGINPVLSPDGTMMAFSRTRSHDSKPTKHGAAGRDYSSTTTWVVDLRDGTSRRLTPWRNGLTYVPESFSPDGSLLALTKSDDDLDGPEIALARVDGGGLTDTGLPGDEAAISPDGARLAFVGYLNPTLVEAEEDNDYTIGELYTANLDGSAVKRLTRNDDKIESSPSWDPSGQRLAYVEVEVDTSFVPGLGLLFPFGNAIKEMNADGSCHQTVRSQKRVAFYGVAWQPGPERGVGRIECARRPGPGQTRPGR